MAYDPHYGSTTLLLHLDGADGSTEIVDSSASPKTVTAYGDAAITTAEGRFGGSCLSLGGAGYLLTQDEDGYAFGTGDFTVEMWAKTSDTTSVLISTAGTDVAYGPWWVLGSYNWGLTWDVGVTNSAIVEAYTPVCDGQWHHIAAVRSGYTMRLFIDGELSGEGEFFPGEDDFAASGGLRIGAARVGFPSSFNLTGYLDEVRVTKGMARYTTGFTPPNEPFASSEPPPTVGAYAAAPTPLGAVQALVSVPITQVWAAAPSPLVAVKAKSGTDIAAAPKSLSAPRFGTPAALVGLPPSNTSLQVKSLTAGKFGVASFTSMLQTGPVQGLQSARFGALVVRVALTASSLAPTQLGTPSAAARAHANSLRPVRFGTASTEHSLAATSLCRTRFGAPGLRLDSVALAAQSLRPVQFGAPSLGSMAMCARSTRPMRFGRPSLDRGAIC